MTLDEIRDWHAERAGWKREMRHTHKNGTVQWWWVADGGREDIDHPFPATIDGAASALPPGWKWEKCNGFLFAKRVGDQWGSDSMIRIDDTGSEIYDRYLLAKLAWEREPQQ